MSVVFLFVKVHEVPSRPVGPRAKRTTVSCQCHASNPSHVPERWIWADEADQKGTAVFYRRISTAGNIEQMGDQKSE